MEAVATILPTSTATRLASSPSSDLFNMNHGEKIYCLLNGGPSLIQAEASRRIPAPEAKRRPRKTNCKRKTMNRLNSSNSFSSASDDNSSFIEFSSSPKTQKKTNFLFQSGETSSSDEEQDEDYDDGDWDEVDSSTPIDLPEEFQNIGLTCPIENGKSSKPVNVQDSTVDSIDSFQISSSCDEEEAEFEADGCENKILNEKFPSTTHISPEEKHKRLKEINALWEDLNMSDDIQTPENQGLPKTKSVQFSDPKSWEEIPEDEHLSKDLKASRINDFAARRADKQRMERLLRPIFDVKHRESVYNRLYGGEC